MYISRLIAKTRLRGWIPKDFFENYDGKPLKYHAWANSLQSLTINTINV